MCDDCFKGGEGSKNNRFDFLDSTPLGDCSIMPREYQDIRVHMAIGVHMAWL
jgi:hypothetical protein